MFRKALLFFSLAATAALAQKYNGPRPPKPDLLYLQHADELAPTDVGEAKEQPGRDEILYVIAGANATARTPLASPILLLKSEKLVPEKLQLYRLESKGGQREVLFSKKKRKDTARPIRFSVTRLAEDNLYKIEVDESLENGEYAFSPEGPNTVFCFQVY